MKNCYFLEKLSTGEFTKPSLKTCLVDASHVREGFRVYRLEFRRVEFMLTNGTDRNWEDNNGQNYVIDSPGRYVIEHGIRRVGEADATECYRTVCRPNDRFVELEFRADLWSCCYCSYQSDQKDWTPVPGEKMTTVDKDMEGKYYTITVEAQRLAFAFNDGGEIWDSNMAKNYVVGNPGKYVVTDGGAHYQSASKKDLDNEKVVDKVEPTAKVVTPSIVEAPLVPSIVEAPLATGGHIAT